jgi:hypothetical protein
LTQQEEITAEASTIQAQIQSVLVRFARFHRDRTMSVGRPGAHFHRHEYRFGYFLLAYTHRPRRAGVATDTPRTLSHTRDADVDELLCPVSQSPVFKDGLAEMLKCLVKFGPQRLQLVKFPLSVVFEKELGHSRVLPDK